MVATSRSRRRWAAVALVTLLPGALAAQAVDTTAFAALQWRSIGPLRGGRSVAVAGSDARPLEYYMGTTGGGVFKTTNGGQSWQPVTDRYFGGTIGALAVAPSNPDIVWAGGGETDIRGNTAPGDGVFKSTDAGRSWTKIEYFDPKNHVNRIRIHPTNPDIVWVGVLGHVFGPNEQRGVFKTTDGGRTWRKVLYRNPQVGISDLALDPTDPNVLYAAFWNAYRTPWGMNSGGPGGGVFKSTDGGETWTELTANPGLPRPPLGKIGLAVSRPKPARVWAIIEADSGGVYRSDDGGRTWTFLNGDRNLRQRAWYYTRIYADPADTNTVYVLNVGFWKSTDGGKSFRPMPPVPHGDNHDLWIASNDPKRMVEANDGGANVSFDGGQSWTGQQYATAQMYHVSVTNHFPYKVCGAQQDNSTLCGPSRKQGAITMADWQDAGGGESGYVTAHPEDPDIVFAGSYGGYLTWKDMRTGLTRNINAWPDNPMGYSSEDIKHKFQWTFPIVISPHDPRKLYVGGSELFVSYNNGESFSIASPRLARNDPKTLGPSGGPITKDQTGVETYGTIFAFAESPTEKGVLLSGSDDGLLFLSRDDAKTWVNITPKDFGDYTRVSSVEISRHRPGTFYVAGNRYQQDDFRPWLFKTTDYGRTWTKIVAGIPDNDFTRVVREDLVRPGLLFAGTERGVYVSFDDGAQWTRLQLNLPPVPVHDLVIKDNDIVVGTHGRSFYILDDISPLRELTPAITAKAAHLFKPADAYRIQWGGGFGGGGGAGGGGMQNPPSGAILQYWLKHPDTPVTIEILDPRGAVVQSYTTQAPAPRPATGDAGAPAGEDGLPPPPPAARPTNRVGLNRFVWNMRYPDATSFPGMIMWAGTTVGPMAPAGTYTARLTAGTEVLTQQFRLLNDPRSPATAADLEEQFAFLMRIRDRVSDANEAVISMRSVKSQITDRTGKAPAPFKAEIETKGRALAAKLSAVEGEVYQVRNRSGQDPLNYPIKLNNKLAALTGVVSSGPFKPTKQSYDVFNELSAKLQVEEGRMQQAYDVDLKAFNELLRRAGLEEIKPPESPRKRTVM